MTTMQTLLTLAALASCALLAAIGYFAGSKDTAKRLSDKHIQEQEKQLRIEEDLRAELARVDKANTRATQLYVTAQADLSTAREQIRQLNAVIDAQKILRLTDQDGVVLNHAIRQLSQEAARFRKTGSSKTNQAELAQQNLHTIVARLESTMQEAA
ncbi:hypothetical protein FQZ97_414190 [compost metagenome]